MYNKLLHSVRIQIVIRKSCQAPNIHEARVPQVVGVIIPGERDLHRRQLNAERVVERVRQIERVIGGRRDRRVTLRDDKGNIVNLNGADWSFSLISTHLYEF